jgi:hypothetical protein
MVPYFYCVTEVIPQGCGDECPRCNIRQGPRSKGVVPSACQIMGSTSSLVAANHAAVPPVTSMVPMDGCCGGQRDLTCITNNPQEAVTIGPDPPTLPLVRILFHHVSYPARAHTHRVAILRGTPWDKRPPSQANRETFPMGSPPKPSLRPFLVKTHHKLVPSLPNRTPRNTQLRRRHRS